MAFDFPSSPTVGQSVTMPDGTKRAWDGVKWAAAQAPGAAVVSNSYAASVLNSDRTGVIIPGYYYPTDPYSDTAFQTLLGTIRTYHIPVLYIVNPSSGPGTVKDGIYEAAIRLLQGAGALVLGYVSTNYAIRSPTLVQNDVTTWGTLYSNNILDGIFYDEMPYDPGTSNVNVTLYQSYYAFAKSRGYNIVVANPGTNQQGVWYAAKPPTADVIVTWENSTFPAESDLAGNFVGGHTDYSWKRNAVLVYGQAWDGTKYTMMKKYAKFLWVTDDVLPNPWDVYPTYTTTIFGAT